MILSKRTLMILALGTLIGFGAAGFIIAYFVHDVSIKKLLAGYSPLYWQLIIGLVFGIISAKAAWSIVELPFLKDIKGLFSNIFQPLKLNKSEIVFISLCAGIGEELFFRGGIQPMLGVWTTAVLFVLLHGYINPFNLPMTVYGLYMTMVIGVMGLMTIHLGIVTSITAHFVIDLILMIKLTEGNNEEMTNPEDAISS